LTKNNGSGFSALSSGSRDINGAFGSIGSFCLWWSAGTNTSNANYRYLFFNFGFLGTTNVVRGVGISVRLLRG
jgi:hypothetical protein